MDRGQIALLMIPAMLVSVFVGVPFFAAVGGVGLFFGRSFWGPGVLPTVAIRIYTFITSPTFIAIPMFVLLGTVMGGAGVAEQLFNGMYKLFGPIRGGLLVTINIICTLLAACTGIAAGPVAIMGIIALPIMLRYKYDHGLACGCISAGGTLGTLIPPSVILVIYGLQAEISVGKLYMAAFMPGFFLSGLFIIYMLGISYIKPNVAPAAPPEERITDYGKELMNVLLGVVPVLLLILAVLGTIFLGIATPTEAAGMGAFGAVLISIAYRKFTWKGFSVALTGCFRAGAMIGGIMTGALFFTSVFLGAGGGKTISTFVVEQNLSVTATIWGLLFIVFLLGFVMSIGSIIFVTVPIFAPVLRVQGVDEIWFALLFCLMCQVAYLTPPFAPGVYLLKPLCPPEITLAEMYKGIIPFIIIDWIAIFVCYFWPPLITWLPGQMIK